MLLDMRHPVHTLGSVEPQSRQSRMYLLACARRPAAWDRLPAACRAIVDLADGFADERTRRAFPEGIAMIAGRLMQSAGDPAALNDAAADLNGYLPADRQIAPLPDAEPKAMPEADEWRGLAALVYLPFDAYTPTFRWVPPHLHDVRLVREVYGNPYRRIDFDPRWRTDTAVSIARGIHARREFSGMPILADALQDAGCSEPAVLNHCRAADQDHVRGCWALDLVLNLR